MRDGRFSMGQVVTGGPDGDVALHPPGRRRTRHHDRRRAGDGGDPAVTIRLTWDDAVAMAAGELAPAEAIAAGRVRVRGDLSVLAEAQAVLAAVQPHLAGTARAH